MKNSISEKLFRISRRKKIPLIINFEVTLRCNLNCIHCYHPNDKKNLNEELTFKQIEKLLMSLKESGTMFLIFTGGEPFLRNDIADILEKAKELEFAIFIFTNGTLVTAEAAKIISGVVPFAVHISLYSLNPEIHDGITRKAGSFEKTIKGIEFIRKQGINPVIKCPIMNENIDSVDELKSWADKEGLLAKIDPFISPCDRNNALEIILHRLPVEAVNEVILNKKLFDLNDFEPRKAIECSAGRNMAGIDAFGNVFPCIVWREKFGNIKENKFKDIWQDMNTDYSRLEECKNCENLPFCGVCPGVEKIEGKEVFCEMAKNIRKAIEIAR